MSSVSVLQFWKVWFSKVHLVALLFDVCIKSIQVVVFSKATI